MQWRWCFTLDEINKSNHNLLPERLHSRVFVCTWWRAWACWDASARRAGRRGRPGRSWAGPPARMSSECGPAVPLQSPDTASAAPTNNLFSVPARHQAGFRAMAKLFWVCCSMKNANLGAIKKNRGRWWIEFLILTQSVKGFKWLARQLQTSKIKIWSGGFFKKFNYRSGIFIYGNLEISLCHHRKIFNIFFVKKIFFLTRYSLLNSYSAKASCLSSHESSKAVRMGSLLDSAIREGEARAR